MAKELVDVRQRIDEYRFCNDLKQKVPCSKEDNKLFLKMIKSGEALPDGVYRFRYENGEETNEFYTIHDPDLSWHETMEYIAFKQLETLQKIKSGVYFFVWLTVFGIVSTILAMMLGVVSLA